MDASLQKLSLKIDGLTAQVAYLSEQAQVAEQQRLERAELVRDLTPLTNQAFSLAVEQLEEIQENIDLHDLLRLFKRILRNGRNLEKMLDQLESLAGLLETVGPLANDAFGKVVDITAEMEAKGYFAFTRGGMKLMDNVVAAFDEEELTYLGENIGTVVDIVRQVTRAETLDFASRTVAGVRQQLEKPVEASYIGLVRQLRDPAVRRGLALTLDILRVIGEQAANRHGRQSNPEHPVGG